MFLRINGLGSAPASGGQVLECLAGILLQWPPPGRGGAIESTVLPTIAGARDCCQMPGKRVQDETN